jgi:hypothetical protein
VRSRSSVLLNQLAYPINLGLWSSAYSQVH